VRVRIVSESAAYVLRPVVRALRSGTGFRARNEGGRAPGGEAAAVAELVDEEVEECWGVGVLEEMPAPGGVAAGVVCV